MKINKETVQSIGELAQLQFNDKDTEEYISSMSNILDMVEEMQSVDTDAIEPMAHPLDQTQRLRSDEVTESDQHASYQLIAPDTEDGLYLVPQVIE